jgi:AcrR family transcriptional regulator
MSRQNPAHRENGSEDAVGRPPKFSRAQVQQAALEIVDRDGLAELTMRTVANALGTGAMTLYGHVRDRADLETLVVDAVLAGTDLPPADGDWQTHVEEICVATWEAVRRHPHAVPLVLNRRGHSPAALIVGEALAAALQRGGLDGKAQVIAFRTLLAVTVGGVEADPGPSAVPAKMGADGATRFDLAFQELLASDPTTYPALRAMLGPANALAPVDIFRETVRQAIAGIERASP